MATAGNGRRSRPTPGMRIVGVNASGYADCNLHGDGFNASYFYGDNGVNYGVPQITIDCHGASRQQQRGQLQTASSSPRATSVSRPPVRKRGLHTQPAPTGWCSAATGITLAVQETSGPALTADAANNLYYQSGWVRGTFPADSSPSDPSGVCAMQTTVNGQAISSYSDPSRDTSQWSQCHGGQISASVDTTHYPNGAGALTLGYSATNAAGAASSTSRAIDVDNVAPSVSLSAPADTASASGTQDVTVTGSAGPSGVADDRLLGRRGARPDLLGRQRAGPGVGIGSHQVTCYDRNNAVNSSGVAATSATADARPVDPAAHGGGDHLRAHRRRAALPYRDRARQGGRPDPHGAAARQACPGSRACPNGPPAGAQVPRPDRGTDGQGDPQAPRQAGAPPRQAGLRQAAGAQSPSAPHRRQAHAPHRPRQAHHGQRIPRAGRRHGAGRPDRAGPLRARRQRARLSRDADRDDQRQRAVDGQGAGRARRG